MVMTNIVDTHTPTPDSPALPDARPNFAVAVATAREVVSNVRPDQLHLSTPCADFDVAVLTGHVLAVLQRVAIIGRGGDPNLAPRVVTDVDAADVVAEFDRLAADAEQAWSDNAVLGSIVTVPWTKLPGAVALMIYLSEVTVHTWDLATATGQQVAWNDGAVAMSLAAMRQGLPAEGRMQDYDESIAAGAGGDLIAPFSAPRAVAPDAPLISQLVAWTGRQP